MTPFGEGVHFGRFDAHAPVAVLNPETDTSKHSLARLAPTQTSQPVGAIAAIAGEQLVRAFAAKSHLQAILARGLAKHPGRQDGGVAGRIVDGGGDARRVAGKVLLIHLYPAALRAMALGESQRGAALVHAGIARIARSDGVYRRRG